MTSSMIAGKEYPARLNIAIKFIWNKQKTSLTTEHNLSNLSSLTDEVLDGNTNKTEQDLVTCTSTEDCVQLENVELELIVSPESLKLSSSSNSLPDEYKSDLKKELVVCPSPCEYLDL
jgi:hypothetical protein